MRKVELSQDLKIWLEETADVLAKETIKLIKHHKKPTSDFNLSEVLFYVYVEKFVGALVENALTAHQSDPNMTDYQRYTFSSEKFKIVKTNLQNEIARGFEQGFKKFSGIEPPEYMCTISLVPDPMNKLPC
jgi:hypothetical protein